MTDTEKNEILTRTCAIYYTTNDNQPILSLNNIDWGVTILSHKQYDDGTFYIKFGDYIDEIPQYAFTGGQKSLLTVDIPSCVKSIANNAFEGCTKLLTANTGSITTVGTQAFARCKRLTTIDTAQLTKVGDFAFYACDSLVEVDLSEAQQVDNSAFLLCSNLTTVTTTPTKIQKIGQFAFEGTEVSEISISTDTSVNENQGSKATIFTDWEDE